jgi:hypothetical protein
MKKILLKLPTFFLILMMTISVSSGLISCGPPSDDEIIAQKTEEQLKEGDAQVPLPKTPRWTEKKEVASIYERCDQTNLILYAYIFASNSGRLIFLGKCVGYGIPYATQFSNPQKLEYNHNGRVTMPQAEPNGLFKPADARGTWVQLLDSAGNINVVYIEPDVIVSPVPLHPIDIN